MKNSKFSTQLLAALMLALMTACSSTPENEDADSLVSIPTAETPVAGTDAVPKDPGATPENLPSDGIVAGDTVPAPAPTEGAPIAPPSQDLSAVPPILTPPIADAQPVAPAPSGDQGKYTVKSGDTLMKIAFEVYGDAFAWRKIYNQNKDKISDFNHPTAGAQLTFDRPSQPPMIDRNGDPYLIREGDTLGKVSNNVYGTKSRWKDLWNNNRQLIRNPNRIYAGFTLYYVPESSVSPKKLSLVEPSGIQKSDADKGPRTLSSTKP